MLPLVTLFLDYAWALLHCAGNMIDRRWLAARAARASMCIESRTAPSQATHRLVLFEGRPSSSN
eukprot:scaffold1964_cov252-Isochrysis_galbana.AAC.17